MLLAQYAPAGVIIDDGLNVVHVRGDVGPYLQLAPGEPTYSLMKMAREGLIADVRAVAAQKLVENGGKAVLEPILGAWSAEPDGCTRAAMFGALSEVMHGISWDPSQHPRARLRADLELLTPWSAS
jgi:hypothetical protein